MPARSPLIDVAGLRDRLARPDPPTVIDVRWSLGGGGHDAYLDAHLPGAVFVDLDDELAGPPGAGGRHPLPDPDALAAVMHRAGVRAERPVIVYDAGGTPPTGAAARAWWILRWAGHPDVRVLDGGYAAWTAAGAPVSRGSQPRPGDAGQPLPLGHGSTRAGGMSTVDAAEVPDVVAAGVLLDARVPARYRGETEPVDPVAGHIPGAVNQPAAETVAADGRLLTPDELRSRFAALGVQNGRPVAAYCGSGVTAAQTVLALTVAGFEPALYVGSWSHWITDPERPVARGDHGD